MSAEQEDKNFLRTPTSWDSQDDILLLHLKDNQKLGWKEIALHFHNRTPNACQFRWRRLKSGNLKNPPKATPSRRESTSEKAPKRRVLEASATGVYSPLASTTFTGYDTVQTALAGLNALGAPASNPAAPPPSVPVNTTSHPQTFDNSPKIDFPLDPQAHSAAAGTHGGYFTDISVDPTLNLPHNKPHPVASLHLTSRQSVDPVPLTHNNSIIQIARDDRALVSLNRLLVLSLPSKSMDIPHHQTLLLAHLPVLYGGSSISGALGLVLGPVLALHHLALALSGIRNGSIVGPSQAYLRRLSMSIPSRPDLDKEREKRDRQREHDKDKEKQKEADKLTPIFKIPWLMEEDELLINRRRKELSFAELSILLPQRTEGEIWARIDALERLRNGPRALARRRRQSLLGLDDVDDFYDDVDSIDMDSDDDIDNVQDAVLVDVDDSVHRPARKRRASSAVNPLTPREIRSRLH